MNRLLLATLVAIVACKGGESPASGDSDASTGGTFVISTAGDADVLIPVYADNSLTKLITEQLFDHLADIAPNLNTVGDKGFTPRLADKWTWAPDSLSIAFHIDPRAKWHDGHPVTARDVAFTYSLYSDPKVGSATGPLLGSIDSVTMRDSATAVVWYRGRSPEQFFDAAYQLVIMPEHLLGTADRANLRTTEFASAPVGNSRFRFVRWVKGSTLELISDTANYRGRANFDRVIITFSPDFTAGVTKLMTGEADFFEILRPDNLIELQKNPSLKAIPYPSMQYGFMSFNLKDPKNHRRPHPILGDRAVRRALSMAVDRKKIVESVFGSLAVAAIGPLPRAMGTADTTLQLIPYDVEGAKRALDSLGWKDANGDGVREKGNRKLEFSLLVPSSSKTRVNMSVLLQEAFRQVGAKVDVEQLDISAVGARLKKRDFETTIGLWQVDPSPGGVRQTWGIEGARASDGSNTGSYESPVFDALVDSALVSMDPVRERAYFKRAYQTIIDDAPAIWLYEPRISAGAHKRIHPGMMRADAWWSSLADWSIPVNERIDRDRIGLRAPATP